MGKDNYKLVANNKKAYHDYFIDETYETGIALAGTEVKSNPHGKMQRQGGLCQGGKGGGMGLRHAHQSLREGQYLQQRPLTPRKLLMHKYEIRKIASKMAEKGYTMVPLKVYLKGSLVKVEVGLARGKKLYDKRQDIAKKDQRREAEKEFKVKNLY
ncbi:MAG: SsrA-binding protein SmpB [Anaerosacchariphilus sp.]